MQSSQNYTYYASFLRSYVKILRNNFIFCDFCCATQPVTDFRDARYSASDMLSELIQMADSGELDSEIIPKVETIENWISRYSAACKREMAAIALERQGQNQ